MGGCSWIFVKPLPPDYQSGDAVDCTVDPTAPIIDTLFVASHIVGLVYLSGKSNDQNKDQTDGLVTTDLIDLITWGSSAIYGYRKISACADARSDDSQSYSHHLGVRHRAYGPPSSGAPPAAFPRSTAPAPDVTPAPQQGDDEKPSVHSAPPPKPWTVPRED
jgi:hypothetical protein